MFRTSAMGEGTGNRARTKPAVTSGLEGNLVTLLAVRALVRQALLGIQSLAP
jgi:hypothetical protein